MTDSPAAILFDVDGNPISTIADGAGFRLKVDARRTVALTAVRTSVNATTSDTLLLATNANRISVVMYNDSDAPLYIGYGSVPVTLINYTLIISSQSERELPIFAGEIRGIWQTESGSVHITEMT